ncbi:hypothetical protein ACFFX0_25800 [Citricoccus parietis]|uniref:Secreted protein n=1 Tax=Citricoccus parietis TaxID=592307 RepID=A0ABV5G645_9MICC
MPTFHTSPCRWSVRSRSPSLASCWPESSTGTSSVPSVVGAMSSASPAASRLRFSSSSACSKGWVRA